MIFGIRSPNKGFSKALVSKTRLSCMMGKHTTYIKNGRRPHYLMLQNGNDKLSRTVLRGVGSRKAPRLPGGVNFSFVAFDLKAFWGALRTARRVR